MTIPLPPFDRRAVLCGAGMSRNWGGYLAGEMWTAILGQPAIEANEFLRALLLRETNFESALEKVAAEGSSDDVKALDEAVRMAFVEHDTNLRHALAHTEGYRLYQHFFEATMRPFMDEEPACNLVGFVFSLNQDLFLERTLSHSTPGRHPVYPGVGTILEPAWRPVNTPLLEPFEAKRHAQQVSWDGALNNLVQPQTFNVIKLHGSANWLSGESGLMVLGGGKAAAIDNHPLLTAYFDVFRQFLFSGGARLLVIGYGFGDRHINKLLAQAVMQAGLRLYIVDVRQPGQLRSDLLATEDGSLIWSGLFGYLARPLPEVFGEAAHHAHPSTSDSRRLKERFWYSGEFARS
jgi:hypothetical protein